MTLVGLIIVLLIFGVLAWIISIIPIHPTFRTILYVVLGLFLLLWLLQQIGAVGPVIRIH